MVAREISSLTYHTTIQILDDYQVPSLFDSF